MAAREIYFQKQEKKKSIFKSMLKTKVMKNIHILISIQLL